MLLSSSGADELSQESRALAGSVFTHHLVSGLRGAADENGDERIAQGEARYQELGEHDDEQRDPEVPPEHRLVDDAEHPETLRNRLDSP